MSGDKQTMQGKINVCPLCDSPFTIGTVLRERRCLRCGDCGLIFADGSGRLGHEEARQRYLLHENGIENQGYCDFLSRAIIQTKPFLSAGSRGLDYGCGPEPTLSKLLAAEGFTMSDYDPIFCDRPLEPPYDFIFSTECFEHFEEPKRDIGRVVGLLRPGGILTIMTELWDEKTGLDHWYYASDLTHVSFYSDKTLVHICRAFGLRRIAGDGRRVFVFHKSGDTHQIN